MDTRIEKLQYLRKSKWFELTVYTPHPAQEQIHKSKKDKIVAICGRRFGKSLLASKEAELTLLRPNKLVWIVAPTYDLTDKVFREVYNTFKIKFRSTDIIKYSETQRIIRFANGSELRGKTADNPDSLIGDGLDLLIFDEAAKCKPSVWQKYLSPTLADSARDGRALFITTPEGTNWIYKLYKLGLGAENEWESFRFPTSVNPHVKQEYLAEAERDLSPEMYRQEYLAEFSSFTGKVYKDYDPAIHTFAGNIKPDDYKYFIVGMDHGFVTPTAILTIGVKDKCYDVIAEVYRPQMMTADVIAETKKIISKHKPLAGVYSDHHAERIRAIRNKTHINVTKAKKDVCAGIETVASKLEMTGEDGRARLRIHSSCTKTLGEIENYKYAENKLTGYVKEVPVKENDHAMDALRYAIHTHTTKIIQSHKAA